LGEEMKHSEARKRRALIIKRWEELDKNNSAIADEFGISRERVRQILLKHNLKGEGHRRHSRRDNPDALAIRSERLRVLKKAYLRGVNTYKELSTLIGCSRHNTAVFINKYLPELEIKKCNIKYTNDEIITLYDKHKNYTRMAEELDISPTNISRLIKNRGLRYRCPSRRGRR
jgi:transposase